MLSNTITFKTLEKNDISIISKAFLEQGWNKDENLYEQYYNEQLEKKRTTIIAHYNNNFAGYITILWESDDDFFYIDKIPEIKDFNVIIKYRCMGIGNLLMNKAEEIVSSRSDVVGLSVGLLSGYGSAQRMYVKRGYIPIGDGIKYKNRIVEYFDKNIEIDDDLVLGFTKKLN